MSRLAIHHQAALARTHAEIAAAAASLNPEQPVSIRSVRPSSKEPAPSLLELSADPKRTASSGPGRPSVAESLREQVATTLAKTEPHLLTSELLRRARDLWAYKGEKTAFYKLVKSYASQEVSAQSRSCDSEGVAGEYAQFDFGERWMTYSDGKRRKVIVFVGRLKFSRHVHVIVVPDQKAETLVRAVVSMPIGVELRAADLGVRQSQDGEDIEDRRAHRHPSLPVWTGCRTQRRRIALHAASRKPQQKGSVERGVGWFKNSFLAQRNFLDADDMASQRTQWLEEVNQRRPSDATGVIPAVRLEHERAVLGDRILPFSPATFALRIP